MEEVARSYTVNSTLYQESLFEWKNLSAAAKGRLFELCLLHLKNDTRDLPTAIMSDEIIQGWNAYSQQALPDSDSVKELVLIALHISEKTMLPNHKVDHLWKTKINFAVGVLARTHPSEAERLVAFSLSNANIASDGFRSHLTASYNQAKNAEVAHRSPSALGLITLANDGLCSVLMGKLKN